MKISHKLNYLIISLLVFSALLIVGSINLLIRQSLEEEIEKKSLTISEYIAEDLINPLLNKNIIRVQEIIDNLKIKNTDVRYAFVVNFDGIVIAHTFSDGFPAELVTANPISSKENSAVQIISANKESIQDIGIRLLEGMDAKVYVGFSRTTLLNSITKTNHMIITIAVLILLFGIVANIILSRKITKPIEALVKGTKRISSGNYDFKIDVTGDDEIRELTTSFNQMTTERKQAEEKLKNTLDASIQTMSKIIEVKDPYTAGHQQRVSQLTTAIAKELNLSPDKVEGIRIASLIHDIGKISVPTEILSKTTTLSDIEFSLIKGHSQAGSDILKAIDFSYPVAQIVLQHHERLNGSGYPNNLKGDEILLEARIIGVADVVEAMSSHRPYRPSLGIDAALDEISKNKGTLYDPEVVDICLKLFKEKEFKL